MASTISTINFKTVRCRNIAWIKLYCIKPWISVKNVSRWYIIDQILSSYSTWVIICRCTSLCTISAISWSIRISCISLIIQCNIWASIGGGCIFGAVSISSSSCSRLIWRCIRVRKGLLWISIIRCIRCRVWSYILRISISWSLCIRISSSCSHISIRGCFCIGDLGCGKSCDLSIRWIRWICCGHLKHSILFYYNYN